MLNPLSASHSVNSCIRKPSVVYLRENYVSKQMFLQFNPIRQGWEHSGWDTAENDRRNHPVLFGGIVHLM